MDERFLAQADLHLRLHLHGLVPLHQALVETLCEHPRPPPPELATVLEDIGQRYMRMADTLNAEIIQRGLLDEEPEEDHDLAETRIAQFTAGLLAGAGVVVFRDGMRVDAAAALDAAPVVRDAIKAAVLVARSRRGNVRLKSVT